MNKVMRYVRVSTAGQNIEAQIEKLKKASCSEIYVKKVSRRSIEKEELKRALRALEKEDTIYRVLLQQFKYGIIYKK